MPKARLLPAALLSALAILFPRSTLYAQKCVAPSFVTPASTTPTAGGRPVDIVTADFNNDGLLDVAVAEELSASVTVLLGTGGGFTISASLGLNSAFALAAADVNHDGNPDIAVAGKATNEVFVFLGDGLGGFTGPTAVPSAAGGPSAIDIGDFNNDGNPDLAVGYAAGPGVAVHLGDGLGSFGPGSLHAMGFTSEMVIGDINHDGNLDVAATDGGANSLVTSLGQGNGSFNPPILSGTGNGPFGLALDDFDGDGLLDVVTADQGDTAYSFMRGMGNGSFALAATTLGPGLPIAYAASGDVDGDGIPDLISPNMAAAQVSVFLGDGTGNFPTVNIFNAPDQAQNLAVGDFDGDGRQDFAVNLWTANQVALFENDYGKPCLNPSFAQVGRIFAVGATPSVIVTGDFDGDLFNDFVTADQASSTVTFYPGTGNGDFGPSSVFGTGSGPISMAVADFTSDGDLDLVTVNQVSNDVSILVNTGTGAFAAPVSFTLPGTPVEVAAADLDFDGKIDLVVALATNDVVVFLGDGTGSFGLFNVFAVGPSPASLTVGDFDNDGIPDLAVAETSLKEIVTLKGVGDGSFNPGANNPLLTAPTSVRAARFDTDGNLDVVVTVGTGAGGFVQVLSGDGVLGLSGGTVTAISGAPLSPHGLTTADVDDDGSVDALVANVDKSGVDVLLGNGTGGFSATRSFPTGEAPRAIAVDDFERDGNLDLAATEPTGGAVWIMPGDGAGFFAPSFFPSTATDTRGVASGDLNHDGLLDLVVANAGSDSITRYLGQSGGRFGAALTRSLFGALKPVWVTVADFDNDGNLDVVTTNAGTSDLSFFGGQGNGDFNAPAPFIVSTNPSISRAADFDFDGLLDLAVLAGNNVELMKGLGGGAFTSAGSVVLGGSGAGLLVDDFDHDGDIDLAATNTTDNQLELYFSAGPGFTFSAGPQFTLSASPRDFDAADFNGDGFLDFVVPSSPLDRVQLVVSVSGPLWTLGTTIGVPREPRTVRSADINGDGNEDFVVVSRSGNLVSFFTGDGTGGFVVQVDRTVGLRNPLWMTIADFDGDARPDVAVVPDTSASPTSDGVAVISNTNCKPTRLVTSRDPSSCDTPGTPFFAQPELFIEDDGGNLMQCNLEAVTAAIVSGTGTGGALLSGVNPVAPVGGTATFTDLSIDLPGGGYQLIYTHPSARLALSRTFSQGLSVAITGPLAVCQGDPAVYDGGLGFDMYDWLLDTASQSMASSADLTTVLGAGLHTLDLNVTRDSCSAFDSIFIDVTADLSAVGVTPSVPQSVCATCSGANIMSTLTGGGLSTYQWGYRSISLGTITPITGETGVDYTIQGTDFPGAGTYFLVVTVTPTCGVPLVSNEVQVDVTASVGPNPVIALTARSQSNENFLEWVTPAAGGCNFVRIIRRSDTFPTDPNNFGAPNTLLGNFTCPAGGKDSTLDVTLVNDTKYYYSAWVKAGTNFSTRKEVTGRPFDHTVGNVLWSYTTGASSLAPPGLRIQAGAGTVYIVSNDSLLHSVDANGFWPVSWKPFVLGGIAQSRPPVPSFPVGLPGPAQAANGAVFVGAQDGDVYAIDADQGDLVWQQNVGALVQAAPAGIFAGFGGAQNLVLIGTRNAAPNTFRAFDADSGVPAWTFQNLPAQGGDGSDIGIISAGASVDYPNQRVFFASRKAAAGKFTLWSLNFSGALTLEWAINIGNLETSPIYLAGPNALLIVANTAGDVYEIDPNASGAPVWLAPFNAGDGAVKGFVFPQFGTKNYLFSTLGKVTSIRDNGLNTNPTQNWQVSIPSASTPLYVPGTTTAIVGGDNGLLYQINGIDTASPTTTTVTLGDGLSVVGAPTFQGGGPNIIYVGTSEGVIYAVQYPLP